MHVLRSATRPRGGFLRVLKPYAGFRRPFTFVAGFSVAHARHMARRAGFNRALEPKPAEVRGAPVMSTRSGIALPARHARKGHGSDFCYCHSQVRILPPQPASPHSPRRSLAPQEKSRTFRHLRSRKLFGACSLEAGLGTKRADFLRGSFCRHAG